MHSFSELLPRIACYRSGASARADLTGYVAAELPLGIDIQTASATVRKLAARYVCDGGAVFVDSGAFAAFRRERTVDFGQVLSLYDEMVALVRCEGASNMSQLSLVMPDVVGNANATIRVQQHYRDRIRIYAEAGVDVLIPVQRGVTAGGWRRHLDSLLPCGAYRIAVPSNAAAFSGTELLALVRAFESSPPRGAHFLGIAARVRELRVLADIVWRCWPGAALSSDANRLRARMPRIQELHRAERARLAVNAVAEEELIDETELWADLDEDDAASISAATGIPVEMLLTGDSEQWASYLVDERQLALAGFSLACEKAAPLVSSRARSLAIAASEDIPETDLFADHPPSGSQAYTRHDEATSSAPA